MLRTLLTVAFLTLCGLSSAADAKSVHKEFSKAWEARDTRYSSETREALAASQAAIDKFGSHADPSTLPAALADMHKAMYHARYREGRGHLLRDFRIHMFAKPTPSMVDMWMQEKVDSARQSAARAEAQFKELGQRKLDSLDAVQAFFRDTEQAIIVGAHAHAAFDEIALLSQNLTLYYADKQAETARKLQERAAMAAAVGAAFSNMGQAYSNMAARSWTAQCTKFNNTTRCSGN